MPANIRVILQRSRLATKWLHLMFGHPERQSGSLTTRSRPVRWVLVPGSLVIGLLMVAGLARPAQAEGSSAVITVTNDGVPVPDKSSVRLHPTGQHNGPVIAAGKGGETLVVPAGIYDLQITFDDGAAHKDVWLDNQTVADRFETAVELAIPVAAVTYKLTNNGDDVKGHGLVQIRPAGQHQGPIIATDSGGGEMRLPAGTYDVFTRYADGDARQEIWFDNQILAGKVEKSVDFKVRVATVTYHLLNNGEGTGGAGLVQIKPAGQRNGPVISSDRVGNEMRVPSGAYGVLATFQDGATTKELWFDNLSFSGRVEQTIDFSATVAVVRYHLTNLGADAGDKAIVRLMPAGQHDGPVVAWIRGGTGEMRIPAGSYDVHATYEDGAAKQDLWFDNETFAGKLDKAIDFNTRVAVVTYHLLNLGEELGAKAVIQLHPVGHHDGPVIASAHAGEAMRVAAGRYDTAVIFTDGLVRKEIWFDHEIFNGKVHRTIDLQLPLAEPVLTATLNGTDIANRAQITIRAAQAAEPIATVPSGTSVVLEAGRYTLTANMPGAEGALRDVDITGKSTLTIPLEAVKYVELKPGTPLPKACTVEVHGVIFEPGSAKIRPGSEPTLQTILKLFQANQAATWELGGHTDTVGRPDNNLTLSAARADAVRVWLIAHGVVANRITAQGYGDTRPLVENDSEANRRKNQRLELRRDPCQ